MSAVENFMHCVALSDAWRDVCRAWVFATAGDASSDIDESGTLAAALSRVTRFGAEGQDATLPRMYVKQAGKSYSAAALDTHQEEGTIFARVDLDRAHASLGGDWSSEYEAIESLLTKLCQEIAGEGLRTGKMDIADITVDEIGLSGREESEYWTAQITAEYPAAVGG